MRVEEVDSSGKDNVEINLLCQDLGLLASCSELGHGWRESHLRLTGMVVFPLGFVDNRSTHCAPTLCQALFWVLGLKLKEKKHQQNKNRAMKKTWSSVSRTIV